MSSDGTVLFRAGLKIPNMQQSAELTLNRFRLRGKKDVLCVSEHTQRYLIYFKNSENCRRHLYRFFKITQMKTNSPNEKQ